MQIEPRIRQHLSALLVALVWGVALAPGLGCAGSAPGDVAVPAPAPSAPVAAAPIPEPVLPILVGVEYALIDNRGRAERVARLVAPLGAAAAMPPCSQVEWDQMQRTPGALVDFRRLDGFVRGFQAAGFRELVVCLGSRSGTAWIGWLDPGRVILPGDPQPVSVVSFTTGSERVRIEPIVMEMGRAENAAEPLATEDGIASLALTPHPVFIHPH
jgi:hypothetical protein